MTPLELRFERNLETAMHKIGESEAVNRFLSKYGNARTRWIYAYWLQKYLEWLRGRGIDLGPDRLVDDNLVSIFKSDATDVRTKRKHTDWLNSYVNEFLVKEAGTFSICLNNM
jgi:hypothetical protein